MKKVVIAIIVLIILALMKVASDGDLKAAKMEAQATEFARQCALNYNNEGCR